MFGFAFRRSRNAMVLLDERRIQLEVNGAYLTLVGLRRGEVVGKPMYELSPDGPVLSARDWAATIARGDFTGERELVRPDGTTVTVQWGAHPETVTGHAWCCSWRSALSAGAVASAATLLPRRTMQR